MSDKRKHQHLELAQKSQVGPDMRDQRFYYEPLLSAHPQKEQSTLDLDFLGKKLKAPLWVSSMTGGTGAAAHINQNLARACNEFGLGMGLGSCRPLLESDEYFDDFNLRPLIGDGLPFYANLGVAQIDELLYQGKIDKLNNLVERLQADGLVIHINPLQEWFQPEGDRFRRSALEVIEELLGLVKFPLIVKEVGQGMGPKSLEALLKLPLAAIEFGAFGGTNFSQLELLRDEDGLKEAAAALCRVGHTASEMVIFCNQLTNTLKGQLACQQIIISGGINSFLDGYYLCQKSHLKAIYGQARGLLEHATGEYEQLQAYVQGQLDALQMAQSFLCRKE